MRITYLHQYFKTPSMSGGTRSFEMARRLVAWGHQVTVVTSDTSGGASQAWRVSNENGIDVHWLPVPYSNHMGTGARIRAFFRFAYHAATRAASLPADVVLATSTPLTIALPGAYASMRQRAPMVFEVRDLWPDIPVELGALRNPVAIAAARWLERFAYRRSRHVVALSSDMKDGVVKTGYSADRVTVIPNSSDIELFGPEHTDSARFLADKPELLGRRLVLYPGTIGFVNGVEYLVDVAAHSLALDPGIAFVVVGDGKQQASVQAYAQERGVLGVNFFLYPPVAKDEVPHAFAAADVICSLAIDFPSLRANSANKFFDALAARKPIAINYLGWQADLIEQEGVGLSLPPTAPERAALVLVEALGDPDWLARAGAAAGVLAETRFSRDLLARQLEQALSGAVP
ncbi:glycosyltransferase WbuB [Xanthomonas citri pv. mangiferaeindicae]|nr:glycosyltransferase WbuB [Xanthomonas citri pv. mangiferaeindicae]